MKKRIVLLTVLIISVGFLFTTNSFADQVNYVCTVDEVGGTSWATALITLTDTAVPAAFVQKGFFFPESKKQRISCGGINSGQLRCQSQSLNGSCGGRFSNYKCYLSDTMMIHKS